jgi:hypothetical protein
MIVAMAVMGVVQVSIHQIVDVITVRHSLVPAPRAVLVVFWMPVAIVTRRARVGIAGAEADHMLVVMVFVRMVKMAIVKIVDMAVMPYRRMAAAGAVLVRMVAVDLMRGHRCFSIRCFSLLPFRRRTISRAASRICRRAETVVIFSPVAAAISETLSPFPPRASAPGAARVRQGIEHGRRSRQSLFVRRTHAPSLCQSMD